jgi:putative transposase
MPGPQPPAIELSERQRALLEQLTRAQTNPQLLVRRAKLILAMAGQANNQEAARQERHDRETARVWRTRWLAAGPRLAAAEARGCKDKEFSALVEGVLADEPRPGTPATFTAEQLTQLVALACEEPSASGRPISHWTPRELANEAIKRKVFASISVRHVGRFLK